MGEMHRYDAAFQLTAKQSKKNLLTGLKVWQWFIIWVVVLCPLCFCGIATCGSVMHIIASVLGDPYTELNVSFPGEPDWVETEKTYNGSYYIWKSIGQVNLDSADQTAIAAYFDNWFTQQGWERSAFEGFTCNMLIETQTLPWISEGYPTDQGGYMEYFPPNYVPFQKKRACLIMWPDGDILNVMIATFNPDWSTAID
jgi:hypothetical protein